MIISFNLFASATNYVVNTGLQVWSVGNNPFANSTSSIQVTGFIQVPTGASLYINNMTFLFNQDAKLIIEKGARVYLNNTILTSDINSNVMWEGVRVEGDSSANQSLGNQGYLSLFNHSEISNAYTGVSLFKVNVDGSPNWATSGARIEAVNSVFKNNERDVVFLAYKKQTSFSRFRDCDFITNIHPLLDGVATPNVHVSMTSVKNIKFKGCRFKNTSNNIDVATRGKGILSIDAGYEVTYHCTAILPYYIPCPSSSRILSSFSNLEYGIDARNANLEMVSAIIIKYSEFNENNRAAYFGNVRNFVFVNNNVNVGVSMTGDYSWPYGLYSSFSSGYTIENNLFKTTHTGNSYGIIIDNSNNNGASDDVNEVYHNTFEDLKYGAVNKGENVRLWEGHTTLGTGLTYRCNAFQGNSSSDLVIGDSLGGGIASFQGGCFSVT